MFAFLSDFRLEALAREEGLLYRMFNEGLDLEAPAYSPKAKAVEVLVAAPVM